MGVTSAADIPDLYLTTAELAVIFKVSQRTVERWAADELLPSLRLPRGHRRFHLPAILEHLETVRDPGESPVDAAARLLGEMEQARSNPLCPRCGKRERVGTDFCGPCQTERRERVETSAELERARKRRNWAKHGAKYRQSQKDKARRPRAEDR